MKLQANPYQARAVNTYQARAVNREKASERKFFISP